MHASRHLAVLAVLVVSAVAATHPPAVSAQEAGAISARIRALGEEAEAALVRDVADSLRDEWLGGIEVPEPDPALMLALAGLERLTYRTEEALALYERVAPADQPIEGAVALAAAAGRAATFAQMWRPSEAEAWSQRAADAAGRLDMPAMEAEVLVRLAPGQARARGVAAALRMLDRADELIPEADTLSRAQSLCARAVIEVRRGGPDIQRLIDDGRALARAVGSLRTEATCATALAQDLQRRGLTLPALEALEQVGALQERVRDWYGYAATLQWRGYIRQTYGSFEAALELFEPAIRHAEASGNHSAQAWALMGLAEVALRLDDPVAAARFVARARPLLDASEDVWGQAVVRSLEGDAANLAGDYLGARRAYEDAVEATALGNFALAPVLLKKLAALDARDGRSADASARLEEATALAARYNMMTGFAVDLPYEEGVLALHAGRFEAAAQRFRDFLDAMPFTRWTQPSLFEGHARLAEALALSGDLDGAVAALDSATVNLQYWRAHLFDRDFQLSVLQASGREFDRDLGIATTIAALVEGGRADEAFAAVERLRARHLLARLVQGKALSVDSIGLELTFRPVSRAALQESLPPNTAMVSFLTGNGDPTVAFAATADTSFAVVLPVAATFSDDISRLVALLESGARAAGLSASLGDAVLGQVLARLPGDVERLVLAPDGFLHRIPFDALILDGTPVLERFETSLVPSASYAAGVWSAPPLATGEGVLAFGDPDFGEREVEAGAGDAVRAFAFGTLGDRQARAPQRLPRLVGSGAEARAVGDFHARSRVLLRNEASEAAFRREATARRWGVVHLATHASVEDRSVLGTSLALAPGDGEDGFVYPEDIAGLGVRADLVVLSACRTAAGRILAGEGVQGLTAPFLEGGARAVVASYWPMGDRATPRIIRDFYAAIAGGASSAAALRSAKLEAIARGESPAVWASLTLVGDGRVAPVLSSPSNALGGLMLLAALVLVALAGALAASRRAAAGAYGPDTSPAS